MTDFIDAILDGMDAAYDFMGEAAIYTERDATAHDVVVILERNLSQYGEVAQVAGKTAIVRVRVSDVPNAPLRGETFSLSASGEVLTVDNTLQWDGTEHLVVCA